MKNVFKFMLALLVFSFLTLDNASAVSLGAYTGFHVGSGTWYSSDITNDPGYDLSISGFQLGFVMDTKVAGDKLINYRLNFGLASSSHSRTYTSLGTYPYFNSSTWDYSFSFTGIELDNTIGFGFFRNKLMRIWAGPKIKLTTQFMGSVSSTHNGKTETSSEDDAFKFAFGGAPVVGANFHIAKSISVGADMGYNILYFVGSESGRTSSSSTSGFYGVESHFFFNACIFFRLGDDFKKGSSTPSGGGGFYDDDGGAPRKKRR